MSSRASRSGTGATDMLLLAAFVAFALGVWWFLSSGRQQALKASPAGFDGLVEWLRAGEIDTLNFTGGWLLNEDETGLLIIPSYDTALDAPRIRPTTKEELLLSQDEEDLRSGPIFEKIEAAETLMVLPKWRAGMRLTGIGHPVLVSERDRVLGVAKTLTGEARLRMIYGRTPFTDFTYRAETGELLTARIYAAQMLVTRDCEPIIGTRGAMLLGRCPAAGLGDDEDEYAADDASGAGDFLLLADPDLLSNHGLRLGENALIARDLVASLAADGRVVVDYSTRSWFRDDEVRVTRERSWADMRRFFEPPFTLLWVGGALAFGAILWRAGRRYGPVKADPMGQGASKDLAIRARARLMRLSDQDGELLGSYTSARIAAAAAILLGPAHGRQYATDKAFLKYVSRRHPDQAARLKSVLETIRRLPDRIGAADAIRHVDDLEEVLEAIRYDT
ncbi:MAG: hypothetical protein AAF871_13670 [Pseudomonadota bacterium]